MKLEPRQRKEIEKRSFSLMATVTAIIVGVTIWAHAQDDDFLNESPDDFDMPSQFEPPPPPPPGFGDPGMPGGNGPGGGFPPPIGAPGSSPGSGPGGTPNPGFSTSKVRRDPKKKFADANPEDITNANFPDLIDSFDYPNAEIADVIKAISELTGKNFIVDPGIRGKITIMAPTQITVAEAYKAFLSALSISGYSVVPSGKFLKIVQGRQAQKDSIEIYSGAYTPNTDQMITRIIQLKHISAAEFNKYLRSLTTKDGTLEVYEPTNTLILSDYGSNVERVMKIVGQIDIEGFEEQMAVIRIKHAKAADIADLVDQIINKGKSSRNKGGSFTAGVPRFGGPNESGKPNAFSLVIPDDRTNAIIVIGNTEGIIKIKDLVRQLDFNIPLDEAGGVFVYYVRYGDAEKIAQTLNSITQNANKDKNTNNNNNNQGGFIPPPPIGFDGGGKNSDSAGAFFGGDVKVTSSKETNSLIIMASRQDYNVVRNLLRKIDIPRNQVFVEAVIMEVNLSGIQNWGFTAYQIAPNTGGIGRLGFAGIPLTNILNPTNDKGAILGFGSGDKVDIDIPGLGTKTVTSLTGFLNIVKENTAINVLSTPQIMALDNQEAEIEVGENVPVGLTTTVAAGGATTNAPQREDATIKLKIKPFISPKGKSIRLELEQSIKQVSPVVVQAKNLADSAISVTKRNVKTNIVINDADTAVLGGLMREQETMTSTKIPLLGDIPILGWLFKSQTARKEKINLLLFLTPRIVKDQVEHERLVGEKLDERIDFIRRNMGGKDIHGGKADKLRRVQSTPPKEEGDVEKTKGPKNEEGPLDGQ